MSLEYETKLKLASEIKPSIIDDETVKKEDQVIIGNFEFVTPHSDDSAMNRRLTIGD